MSRSESVSPTFCRKIPQRPVTKQTLDSKKSEEKLKIFPRNFYLLLRMNLLIIELKLKFQSPLKCRAGFFCKNNALNPQAMQRNWQTKKAEQFWQIYILLWWYWPKHQFCQVAFFGINVNFYHSRIEVLQNCSVFLSVSLTRENLRVLRELFFTEKSNPRWNLIKLMCFTISLDIFLIFAFILNVCDINGCLTSRRDNWNFCKKKAKVPKTQSCLALNTVF